MTSRNPKQPATRQTPQVVNRVDDLHPLWVARYRQAALLCGLASALLGLSVLLGWTLDEPRLKQVLPGLATMKANTAVGFLFNGIALAVSSMSTAPRAARVTSIALAAFVALMGLLTLTEYLLALDLGIDQLLIRGGSDAAGQAPGRMAPATAVALLCLGLALALQGAGRWHRVSQGAAAAGGLIGFLAVLGYAYGVDALYGVGAYSSLALHTAVGLVVLGLGTLLARPSQGLMRLMADTTAGGVAARRLLPFVLGAPFMLGWLHVQAERGAQVKGAFGIALITVAYVLLFAVMVWLTANALRLSELRRKAVQRDLHKQELQLDDIIRSVTDAVVVMDGEHRIVLFNPAAEAMFGCRSGDMVGRTLETLLPPPARARHDDLVQAFGAGLNDKRRTGGARSLSAVRADGRRFPVEVSISKLDADGQRYYTAVLRDVTELRERTEQARLAAEAANRTKSAFLANMSHEIRTPLNAILGLSGLLQGSGPTPEQAERLGKIDVAARHLLSIINDILDLSRIEAGRLQLDQRDFHLAALFDDVQSIIGEQARGKGIAVRVDLDAVPPWLHGDLTRLGQALLNYAGNAVKFTEQGSITLRARLAEQTEAGLLVRFEVQDTGVGIAADNLPRLFNVFEQADTSITRVYGGSGLGLAITKHLARLMGGDVGASSVPGEGSTFWFTARLSPGRGPQRALAADLHAGPEHRLRSSHHGARVLLVEDNPVNREVAKAMLERAGLEVDSADNGQRAIEMAQAHDYEVILMDVQMPVLDGLAATRRIRALPQWASQPIIGLSANAFNEDRELCLQAGMNDFVAKPVEPAMLYGTLLRWLPKRANEVEWSEPPDRVNVPGGRGDRSAL